MCFARLLILCNRLKKNRLVINSKFVIHDVCTTENSKPTAKFFKPKPIPIPLTFNPKH